MLQSLLSINKILLGCSDVNIKCWRKVVHCVNGFVMPLCLGLCSSHDKLMLVHLLSNSKRSHVGLHITVFTVVWDVIVDWVTESRFLLFVLGAAS